MKGVYVALLGIVVIACSPKPIPFSEEQLDGNYFRRVYNLVGWKDTLTDPNPNVTCQVEQEKIFQAFLVERAKELDGIAMVTIENIQIGEEFDLGIEGNEYRLYIILTSYGNMQRTIFIPSIFEYDKTGVKQCINVGPALVGEWGGNRLAYFKVLKWSTKTSYPDQFRWRCRNKDNKKEQVDLSMFLDGDGELICFPNLIVKQIVNAADNALGGDKPALFNIQEIFGDSRALYFKQIK